MSPSRIFALAALVAAVGWLFAAGGSQGRATAQPLAAALGTAFTYQGQLQDNGAPASGSYDMRFVLYDAEVGGAQVPGSSVVTKSAVAVSDGLFTVQLDFGDVFGGAQLFLEIAVRPAGAGSFTTLSPRQELTPAPFARFAVSAQSAQSAAVAQSVAWGNITGRPAQATRQILVPGGAMSHAPNAAITPSAWGPRLTSAAPEISFAIPRPTDWDTTKPFTVTLYFALPTAPAGGTLNWRLNAGSSNLNLPPANADSGWDSLDFSQGRDAGALSFAASSRTNIAKSQAWVAQFSDAFNTWYMGSAVTTNNDFSNDPVWQFSFQRGAAAGNGETYTGDLIVVAAEVSYVAR